MTTTSRRKVLITAALPYANGDIHVGHVVGAYLPADIYARFRRLRGDDVIFVCGSDDYGVGILISAERQQLTPRELATHFRVRQKDAFAGIGISFDIYSGTSINLYHHEIAQNFFQVLNSKGVFTKKVSDQFYDPHREMFLPDRFVQGTCGYCGAKQQHGDQCEQCGKMLDCSTLLDPVSTVSGKPAEIRQTTHWYLDLRSEGERVASWLESATLREPTRAYVAGLLENGLIERSMTRDITWGIPVPLDDPDAAGKVLYVWFDAPIGYISNLIELASARTNLQQADSTSDPRQSAQVIWNDPDRDLYHFIGEDNTIFHTIIWIAMLAAHGGYRLPTGVLVNHFLNIKLPGQEEEKISKSKGNCPEICDYLEHKGNVDALRYYIASILTERGRGTYQPDALIQRYNSELADAFGNLVHRVASFLTKHCGGLVPTFPPEAWTESEAAFTASFVAGAQSVTEHLDNFRFRQGLEEVVRLCRETNRYLDSRAPWKLRQKAPDTIGLPLATSLSAIRSLTVLFAPFIPHGAEGVWQIVSPGGPAFQDITWEMGLTLEPAAAVGTRVGTPNVVFPKIDTSTTPLPVPYAPPSLRDKQHSSR